MSEFELLRNVTIGQYIPTESVIHRLDPRTKIAITFFLVLATTFARSILETLLLLGIALLIAAIAKISPKYVLRGMVLGIPILVMVFTLSLLFRGWEEPAGRVYFEWWYIRLTRNSIWLIVLGLLRIIALIFLTSLVTMTSTITELTHGVEKLLDPFRRFGIPSHELALIVMIALRFVPTFAEEMERVMKAQASRCADLSRSFWRPDKAARAYLPLIVPLFINAFRRAEELVYAMEARCYISGDGRTKFVTLKSNRLDYIVAVGSLVLFVIIQLIPWPSIRIILLGLGLDIL
ncbi:MAG: energy-coupling factor transporter transmembrane protein EcfT [Anaerolineales bacterium]|nr:energy-coupling factor transporter transmembrane protein EcfT [Anaerolineales bacterium]